MTKLPHNVFKYCIHTEPSITFNIEYKIYLAGWIFRFIILDIMHKIKRDANGGVTLWQNWFHYS